MKITTQMALIHQNTDFDLFLNIIRIDSHALMLEEICSRNDEGYGKTTRELIKSSGQPRESLEVLLELGVIEYGKNIPDANKLTFTWVLSQKGEMIKPYVMDSLSIREYIGFQTLFGYPHSKGVPPFYLVVEMLLNLSGGEIIVSDFEKTITAMIINSKTPDFNTYRLHKSRLIKMGILYQDEIENNDRRITWAATKVPEDLYPNAKRVAELLASGGYYSKVQIADRLGIGTTTVQSILSNKLKSCYRIANPTEYTAIRLTEKGTLIAGYLLKAFEALKLGSSIKS